MFRPFTQNGPYDHGWWLAWIGGGLRGIGPALAGNVGTGWAFALNARGDQGVDVPMLASDLSRSAWIPFVGDRSCARRKARGRMGLSRYARGDQGVDVPMLAKMRLSAGSVGGSAETVSNPSAIDCPASRTTSNTASECCWLGRMHPLNGRRITKAEGQTRQGNCFGEPGNVIVQTSRHRAENFLLLA